MRAAVVVSLLLVACTTPTADAAVRRCAGKRVTIVGTNGPDVLRGTRRADVIAGLAGNDVISGLGGRDTICGDAGVDDLRGNGGADRIYGGRDGFSSDGEFRDGDRLRGGPGNDKLVPGVDPNTIADGAFDHILYDTSPRRVVVNLAHGRAKGDGSDRLVVNGPISVTATRFADRVIGSRFKDLVFAQEGADYVSAGAGNDTIATDKRSNPFSRDAGDQAIGGPGDDFIFSIGRNDVLKGGLGNDEVRRFPQGGGRIEGGPGSDNVSLETELDALAANVPAKAEHVIGGSGVDQILIAAPTDTTPPATFDMATGAFHLGTPAPMNFVLSGVERNFYGGGTWQVAGSSGRDFVDGILATSVHMSGLAGDDTLRGSLGDDTFNGGAGTLDCFQHPGSPDGNDSLTAVELVRSTSPACPWPTMLNSTSGRMLSHAGQVQAPAPVR
jgi:Ca2+-binding RTX toxin-like protein